MKGIIHRNRIAVTLVAAIVCGILSLAQINMSRSNRNDIVEKSTGQDSLIDEETFEEIHKLLVLIRKESIDIVRANMIAEIGRKGPKAKPVGGDGVRVEISASS
jgi:hypothetical protein